MQSCLNGTVTVPVCLHHSNDGALLSAGCRRNDRVIVSECGEAYLMRRAMRMHFSGGIRIFMIVGFACTTSIGACCGWQFSEAGWSRSRWSCGCWSQCAWWVWCLRLRSRSRSQGHGCQCRCSRHRKKSYVSTGSTVLFWCSVCVMYQMLITGMTGPHSFVLLNCMDTLWWGVAALTVRDQLGSVLSSFFDGYAVRWRK